MFEPMYTIGSKIGNYTVTNFEKEHIIAIGEQEIYGEVLYELDHTVWVTLNWIRTIGKIH